MIPQAYDFIITQMHVSCQQIMTFFNSFYKDRGQTYVPCLIIINFCMDET